MFSVSAVNMLGVSLGIDYGRGWPTHLRNSVRVPMTAQIGARAPLSAEKDGGRNMAMRLFGGAMVLFGIAGGMASYGIWWAMYRFGESVADSAGGPPIECVHYCDGMGGPALAGLIVSGGLAVLGLILVLASLTLGSSPD